MGKSAKQENTTNQKPGPAVTEPKADSPQAATERMAQQLQLVLGTLELEERLGKLATSKAESAQPADPPLSASSMWWYTGGFWIVGFVGGLFTGWSNTPVVGALIPLLFGLLGGAGGLYLGSARLTEQRLLLIGRALLGFAVLCLLGAVLGVSMRTRTGILDLLPRFVSPSYPLSIDSLKMRAPEDSLQLVLLRSKLQDFGMDEASQEVLLTAVGAKLDAARQPLGHVISIAAALEAAGNRIDQRLGATPKKEWQEFADNSMFLRQEALKLREWAARGSARRTEQSFVKELSDLRRALRKIGFQYTTAEGLADLAEEVSIIERKLEVLEPLATQGLPEDEMSTLLEQLRSKGTSESSGGGERVPAKEKERGRGPASDD